MVATLGLPRLQRGSSVVVRARGAVFPPRLRRPQQAQQQQQQHARDVSALPLVAAEPAPDSGGEEERAVTPLSHAPLPHGSSDYARESVLDIVSGRTGWLAAFSVGLLMAALVVENFEGVLQQHVELSFFVPLIMGHGGNTGSQAVTTVIRALALGQISARDAPRVVLKEAGAGCMMGATLGLGVFALSLAHPGVSPQSGAAVAIALPLVSLWANGLGALLTLLADKHGFDPAVTSVPLVTTLVDTTGLMAYFYIAKAVLSLGGADVE